jgi:hypothetical protein
MELEPLREKQNEETQDFLQAGELELEETVIADRRLENNVQPYFNPTRTNIKTVGVRCPLPSG